MSFCEGFSFSHHINHLDSSFLLTIVVRSLSLLRLLSDQARDVTSVVPRPHSHDLYSSNININKSNKLEADIRHTYSFFLFHHSVTLRILYSHTSHFLCPHNTSIFQQTNKQTNMSAPFGYNPYDSSLPQVPSFTVTSTDIVDGGTMPPAQLSAAFGVEGGQDVSPSLSWHGFPQQTKSFVVSCYDPDARAGSGYWHWVMYDIPAAVSSLETGAGNSNSSSIPSGAKMLQNDSGMVGFLGAAPPPGHGTHRYIFCVTALSVETLPIDEHATSPAVCHSNMVGHVLGRAFLTATFGR